MLYDLLKNGGKSLVMPKLLFQWIRWTGIHWHEEIFMLKRPQWTHKVDLTVEYAVSAVSRSTARPREHDCRLLKTASTPRRLGAMLVLSLVWRYLICGFGGGGFGVGAEWAPGQGKGADSALRPPRSCSSSCLPDWRAVDQPESSSLNTKPDSGKLPGAYCKQGSIQLEHIVEV